MKPTHIFVRTARILVILLIFLGGPLTTLLPREKGLTQASFYPPDGVYHSAFSPWEGKSKDRRLITAFLMRRPSSPASRTDALDRFLSENSIPLAGS